MSFLIIEMAVVALLIVVLVLTKNFKKKVLEPLCLGLALAGILCLFQPFSLEVFGKGFSILLVGFVGYNVAAHLK
jgi:glycerol uptake facilitator-like aquaporin